MLSKGMIRVLCGLAVAGLVVSASVDNAVAKPPFVKAFTDSYPAVKEAADAKCGVCHIGKPADKKWNDYGTAMKKNLKEKATPDDVKAALKKIESEKSGTEGKTFGDLLKDGKLPGKA